MAGCMWCHGDRRVLLEHGGVAMMKKCFFGRLQFMAQHYFELEQKDIDEFKVLYMKHYGIELDDLHAKMLAHHLIAFMSFILLEQ